ncbi:MAG: hypothetical protein HY362_04605 [Candidatus Aenigmarchaeota archaeon]|nr:hypothetical protein [Candidatus Aenigmarchaeota archaeon]
MRKEQVYGVVASLSLIGSYFLIVSIAQGFEHALESFLSLWYLMLPLITGFGFQVYLFSYIRQKAVAGIAATGGVSTGSMAACCAHHIADVLPIAGLSGATLFFSNYQPLFLIIGILSNAVGIMHFLSIAKKHSSLPDFIKPISKYNIKAVRDHILMLSPAVIVLSFILLTFVPSTTSFKTITESQNSISYDITPISLEPPVFSVSVNTHSGSLDSDFSKNSVLEDNKGNKYTPLRWEGSPPGGHHITGKLFFPEIKGETGQVKLTISSGNSPLSFTWV